MCVLELVEQALDQAGRVKAEMTADQLAARGRAAGLARAGADQKLRRRERAAGDDDGARADDVLPSVGSDVLDPGRLRAVAGFLDRYASDRAAGAQFEPAGRPARAGCRC